MDRYSGNNTMIKPVGLFSDLYNIETETGVIESTGNNWNKIIPVLAIILVVFLLVRK